MSVNSLKKRKYIIMWSYYDRVGTNSGKVEMLGTNRKDAEDEFYRINRPYIIGKERGQPIFNPEGGFVCECVVTYQEWLNEGTPEYI